MSLSMKHLGHGEYAEAKADAAAVSADVAMRRYRQHMTSARDLAATMARWGEYDSDGYIRHSRALDEHKRQALHWLRVAKVHRKKGEGMKKNPSKKGMVKVKAHYRHAPGGAAKAARKSNPRRNPLHVEPLPFRTGQRVQMTPDAWTGFGASSGTVVVAGRYKTLVRFDDGVDVDVDNRSLMTLRKNPRRRR